MEKVLLSIPEAAERLSLGRSKLYELMTAGELKAVRIGRAVRLHTSEIDRFAERLREQADGNDGA